jgi:hypothetical protein
MQLRLVRHLEHGGGQAHDGVEVSGKGQRQLAVVGLLQWDVRMV